MPKPARPSPCPTDDTVAEFVDGGLSGAKLAAFEQHLVACASCARLAATAGQSRSRDASTASHSAHPEVARPVPPASVGDSSFSHYELGREIARGGMGRIIEAWDVRHQRPVAVKMLLRAGAAATRRFAREVEITAHLQHPAIIPLYEAGRTPAGDPFFAMKRVDGRALADVITATHDLAARLALLPQLIAVCEALAYAHEQGIVHRDLKPANVLIGAFGEAVVIDWGLAKILHEKDDPRDASTSNPKGPLPLTAAGATIGTAGYMPPEQARGHAVDERSDVYALGALLYHVFAGAVPYTGATPSGVIASALQGPARPLRAVVPELSPDLAAIVDKAMARDPAHRYANAGALAGDLRRFEAGQLVSARAYSLPDRVSRWVSRRRALVGTAAVLLVALLVTLTVSIRRVVNERDRADASKRSALQQRDAAEHLVQFAIGDLRDRLEPLGKLDLLAGLGGEVEGYYGKLDTSSGPPDRQALARRAAALDVLGNVETRRQDFDVAERLRRQQIAIWERVVAVDARDAEGLAELALALLSEAWILDNGRGRYDDGFALYQRATSVSAQAVDLAPDDVRWRTVEAYVGISLARSMYDRDQLEAPIAASDRVREEAKTLRDSDTMNPRFRNLLALVHCDLGAMEMRLERLDDASASRGRCSEVLEAMLVSRPGGADELQRLATARRGVAYARRLQGRVGDASSELERALSVTRELSARDRGDLDVQRELGFDLSFLADSRGANGDFAGADTALHEGLSVLRDVATARADNMRAQRDLIRALQIAGELETTRGDSGAAVRVFDEAAAVIARLQARLPDASKRTAFVAGFVELWISKACAEVLAGRLDGARATLDATTAVDINPDNADDVFALARIDLVRGHLARARGQYDEAEGHYGLVAQRAEASAVHMPQYPEPKKVLAEAWLSLGEVRRQRGDRERGRTLGAQAAATLAELETTGLLEAARRPLLARARALAGAGTGP